MEELSVFYHNPSGLVIARAQEWFGEENVVNAVGALPLFGHGAYVTLFGWSQPVETNPEKARVQFRQGNIAGPQDIDAGDRRRLRLTPGMFAPFLDEIRITCGMRARISSIASSTKVTPSCASGTQRAWRAAARFSGPLGMNSNRLSKYSRCFLTSYPASYIFLENRYFDV